MMIFNNSKIKNWEIGIKNNNYYKINYDLVFRLFEI